MHSWGKRAIVAVALAALGLTFLPAPYLHLIHARDFIARFAYLIRRIAAPRCPWA